MSQHYDRKYVPFLLVLYFFLTASHVVGFFISNGVLGVALFAIFFFYLSLFCVNRNSLIAFCTLISIGMLCALIGGNYAVSLNLIYFSMMLVLISNVSLTELAKAVDIICTVLLWILLLALISLVYKSLGGQPLAEFKNPDGRPNYWMLTSFSNANYSYFMRPSGIFDEPGALSFHCCAAVFCRCMITRELDGKSTLIVILGFVTLSLAHFVFAFLYFLVLLLSIRKFKTIAGVLSVILMLLAGLFFLYEYDSQVKSIVDFFLGRFAYSESAGFSGNSRSGSFANALNAVSDSNLWLGLYQESCYLTKSCLQVYGNYQQNFFTPLVEHGLIISSLYYLPFIAIFVLSVFRLNVLAIAFLLLWVQRPYYMAVGYTYWFVLFIFLAFYRKGYRVNRFFL